MKRYIDIFVGELDINHCIMKFIMKGYRPCIFLFLIPFLLYIKTLNYSFSALDDYFLIQVNGKQFLERSFLFSAFTEPVFGAHTFFYRPLLMLSFTVDALIGDLNPGFFHCTNVLLHCITVLLIYVFLIKIGIQKNISFFLCLFFAIHPINTHAVAWIPGRNDIILAFFVIASLVAFMAYSKTLKKQYLLIHCLLFISALLTKESALLIPFVSFVFYWIFIPGKKNRNLLLPVILWILILIGWYLLRSFSVKSSTPAPESNILVLIQDGSLAFIAYMGKILFPLKLSLMGQIHTQNILFGSLAIILLGLIILRNRILNRRIFYWGLLLCILFLIPSIIGASFDQNNEHFEHRMYLPFTGLLLMISQIKLNQKFQKQISWLFFITLMIFGYQSFTRQELYANPGIFAKNAVKDDPDHYRSYKIRGDIFLEEGKHSLALKDYDMAMELQGSEKDDQLFSNRGIAHSRLGNWEKALEDFNSSLRINTDNAKSYSNRANIKIFMQSYKEAIEDFNQAIQIENENPEYFSNRGIAYYYLQDFPAAIDDFDKAIAMDPQNSDAYFNRAMVYLITNNQEKACIDLKKASQLGHNKSKDLIPDYCR
jgi:protein O-mannosyl-transferase